MSLKIATVYLDIIINKSLKKIIASMCKWLGGGVVSGLILDLKSESSELLFPEPIMISSIQEHKSHSDYLLI